MDYRAEGAKWARIVISILIIYIGIKAGMRGYGKWLKNKKKNQVN